MSKIPGSEIDSMNLCFMRLLWNGCYKSMATRDERLGRMDCKTQVGLISVERPMDLAIYDWYKGQNLIDCGDWFVNLEL